MLVTYNGKSFDMPLLSGRASVWRVALPPTSGEGAPGHLDLLYECRRRWGGTLADCRLKTVEEVICRRPRSGDIPGAEIPAAYHAFVAGGDARHIGPILWHNALDLVATAEILLACLEQQSG